jgi:inosine-uridine nucleoside N-ribohydrolase
MAMTVWATAVSHPRQRQLRRVVTLRWKRCWRWPTHASATWTCWGSGRLTNLGAALRVEPGLLGAFRTVTIMGGTGPRLAPGSPDPTHGVGDPNTSHDPEAARIVAAAPGDVVLAGVDVTMNTTAGVVHVRRMANATTAHGGLADRVCRFYLDFYESRSGERRLALHDPIAALVATAPASIAATFVTGEAVVEGQAGAERCVLAPIGPGARVTRGLAGCDSDLVAEAMIGALERPMPIR